MAETKKTAGRPKKVVEPTENIKDTNVNDELKKAKEENKMLANQLDEMRQMMLQMQSQMQSMSVGTPQQIVVQQDANKDLTRTVKVTCMIGNEYWLSTEPYGKGKTYRFNGYGDTKTIKYLDMINVVEVYAKQFEQGMAILSSKKDYEDLQIEYIYDNIFDKDSMDKIISLDTDESVDVILNMEDEMQEKVLMMIAEKVANGFGYDFNKIKKLEKETNLNQMIGCFEETKENEDEE